VAVNIAELAVILRADDQITGVLDSTLKKLDDTHKAMLGVGAAMTAVGVAGAGAFGEALSKAGEFEKTMSGVKAVMSPEEVDAFGQSLSDLALKLGKDTVYSAKEAAEGIEELVKGGISATDILDGAAAATLNLAAAGGTSLKDAAEIASNALNTFNLRGEDMAHVADLIAGAANASSLEVSDFKFALQQVGAVAKVSGQTIDDTATAIAILGNAGVKGSDAGTSLKVFLTDLVPKSKQAAEEMKKLGLITEDGANQFFDASGKAKSFGEIADLLQNAMAGLTEQEKLQSLHLIFGTDAMRAAAIMADAGAEGFDQMAESMGKVTAEAVAATRLDNLAGSMEQLKGSVETLAITVGERLLPVARVLVDRVTDLVNWFLELPEPVQNTAVAIGVVVTAVGLLGGPLLMLAGALPAITASFGLVGGAIAAVAVPVGLVTAAIAALAVAWVNNWGGIQDKTQVVIGWVTDTAIPALQSFAGWIGDNVVPVLKDMAFTIGEKVLAAAKDFSDWFGEHVQPVLNDLGDWLQNTGIPYLKDFAFTIAKNVLAAAQEFSDWFAEHVQPTLDDLGQWLQETGIPAFKDFAGFLKDTVLPAVQALGGWIKDHLLPVIVTVAGFIVGEEMQAFRTLAGFLAGGFIQALHGVGNLLSTLGPILGNLFGGIQAFVTWGEQATRGMRQIGQQIIQGFLQGLGEIWATVGPTLAEKLGGLLAFLQSPAVLNINSPSRTWADRLGRPSGEGYIQGTVEALDAGTPTVTAAVVRVLGTPLEEGRRKAREIMGVLEAEVTAGADTVDTFLADIQTSVKARFAGIQADFRTMATTAVAGTQAVAAASAAAVQAAAEAQQAAVAEAANNLVKVTAAMQQAIQAVKSGAAGNVGGGIEGLQNIINTGLTRPTSGTGGPSGGKNALQGFQSGAYPGSGLAAWGLTAPGLTLGQIYGNSFPNPFDQPTTSSLFSRPVGAPTAGPQGTNGPSYDPNYLQNALYAMNPGLYALQYMIANGIDPTTQAGYAVNVTGDAAAARAGGPTYNITINAPGGEQLTEDGLLRMLRRAELLHGA